MEHHKLPTSTYTLKVNINCCKKCQEKVMGRLKKMDGLDSVIYDSEKRILAVSGNIDPPILINKFDKWGRKAELYSFQKNSMLIDSEGKSRNCCSSKKKPQFVKSKDLDYSDSESDDNNEEGNYDVYAPKKHSNKISFQDPSLLRNSPKEESSVNKKSAKKGKKIFGWFCNKDKAAVAKASSNKDGGARKWHFPRTSTPEYDVPGPFGPPPYGDPRVYYMNQHSPMMLPRPMRPYYGYRSMPIPVPPPYGYFQPRSPAPVRMNPMIHYTSYQDNDFYYP